MLSGKGLHAYCSIMQRIRLKVYISRNIQIQPEWKLADDDVCLGSMNHFSGLQNPKIHDRRQSSGSPQSFPSGLGPASVRPPSCSSGLEPIRAGISSSAPLAH